MADDIRTLSARLAQDPHSLAFLELGELLRRKGQIDAAHRVALAGLGRHPHNANAHDLYARILADKRDYERAFDEWDMALRIAPRHLGALKGLAFLYFKVGDIAQAEAHLAAAQRAVPDDPGIAQALAMVRGAARGSTRLAARPAGAGRRRAEAPRRSREPASDRAGRPADQGLEEAAVFAALGRGPRPAGGAGAWWWVAGCAIPTGVTWARPWRRTWAAWPRRRRARRSGCRWASGPASRSRGAWRTCTCVGLGPTRCSPSCETARCRSDGWR
jgi:tetratricopeptide (TPR) repeat protein